MDTISLLDSRINAFVELGKIMGKAADGYTDPKSNFKIQYPAFSKALQTANYYNPWFTPQNILYALKAWEAVLKKEAITDWINLYNSKLGKLAQKKIAVIMAGNIPLVGFHDFMCIMLAGHCFTGKLSSDDKILLPAIAELLCTIEPTFSRMIEFTESPVKNFDAIIATGSNNSARYFDYYFSKFPHIIRKNRNGVAVLKGDESAETLARLGNDICTYFGLGCRNVSKVFIPEGFYPGKLFTAIETYAGDLYNHFKYMNNHSYYSSVYLLNSTPFLNNGVLLLTESDQYSSPIPVLYYQYYNNIDSLRIKLENDGDLIQCIASEIFTGGKNVPVGYTQTPGLADYADGIDTMEFLLNL